MEKQSYFYFRGYRHGCVSAKQMNDRIFLVIKDDCTSFPACMALNIEQTKLLSKRLFELAEITEGKRESFSDSDEQTE